ncbi:MAG: phosphocholine cytidylyltransferase family protein [Thermodesulfobacteria bacterium]|nr:phosphocholine cytidylyltransferase family protein [Thermodesulfobacteriota bacterium]
MKAIILSAGQGKRLLPLTKDKPKCLVGLEGRAIIEWQIDVLRYAGVDDIVVVVGYQAEKVERLLRQRYGSSAPRFLLNPDYATTDNLWSCWRAREEMDGPFILLNGDTLFEPEVLERLFSVHGYPITVTVNRKPAYDADDMKVILDGERLLAVGKDLPLEKVGAESIGLLKFDEEGARLFREALEEAVKEEDSTRRWYLSVIDRLARRGVVGTCDITGLLWCEIDYHKDLVPAKTVVKRISEVLGGPSLAASAT